MGFSGFLRTKIVQRNNCHKNTPSQLPKKLNKSNMTIPEIITLDRILGYLSLEQLEKIKNGIEDEIQDVCAEFILEDNERMNSREELKEVYNSYELFLARVHLIIKEK